MDLHATAEAPPAPHLRERQEIPDRFKWDLTHIFAGWSEWQAAYDDLEKQIAKYAALQGSLTQGADHVLAAMRLSDDIGQLTYKVWYFASLRYDEDQRDNQINARRQQVQILFAKASQASAWFNPELLTIPLATIQKWMSGNSDLAMYGSRSRILPPAGTRARRQGRAPARFRAASRRRRTTLFRAVDRGRLLSDGATAERRRSHAHLRTTRDSRHAPQPGRPRRAFNEFHSSTPPTSTPTRRSTTACCSATGFIHRHASTRRRSTRRSTATTSRRPWSKT
jgi:hypothetical protein